MSFHPNDIARRGRRAGIIVTGIIVVLLGSFFKTQVLNHSQWVMQSEDNRLRQIPIPAPRGVIYDRKGEVIAENSVAYNVSMLVKNRAELLEMLDRLSELIPMSRKTREDAIKRMIRDPARPVSIFPDASFDQVAVLEEHRTDFPALIIAPTPKRVYPEGKAVWAFSGYTSEVSEEQLTALADSGYRPGQQIGKSGLERQYESVLRGREGGRFVEVDARNRVMREQGARPDLAALPGKDLKTYIDLDLQRFVFNIFGDSLIGAIVAVDPQTGGVLAMHTAPAIDPNRYIGGLPQSLMDSLQADTVGRPQLNKALQGTYPPGSTWKLATSVIALEDGAVKWDETFDQSCTGSYYFGNRAWKCWKPEGHGRMKLAQAIAASCDVYFYQLGLRLSLEQLSMGGARMGFNKTTGIDLPGENRGKYPDGVGYFNQKYGPRGWSRGLTLSQSIGQGDNAQTVLNMARFYTALATDGFAAKPEIVRRNPERTRILNITPQQLDVLKNGLRSVVTSGTAAASAIKGVTLAGKTGTAQSGRFVNGTELDHAWFAGFAPAEAPKIVVVVMIEFGGHGTRSAHLASAIIEHYLKVKPVLLQENEG